MLHSDSDPSFDREREIFLAALERPSPGERAAFLDGACARDAPLRARLESLLQRHSDDAFLEDPAADLKEISLSEPLDGENIGDWIGRYKLREKIGEGGCGAVYVAEQEEPVRRKVALKVIKLGMDTRSVVARFEAERQALAMMDHPNIARVFDAGATETGRPYFVMELVRGIRITDYCDENQLSTRERLDLFIKVCQAIQHAHQKGIIHRDIKPSNILVTLHDGVPVPKVIDFGIAKATEGRLTEGTIYTHLHQFIGTPAYMSPEQAEMSGLDIDTRSDIYSLGVLLYELLVGSTPFDAEDLIDSGIDAMRKTIREKEPVRPSTKLTQTLMEIDRRRTSAAKEPRQHAKEPSSPGRASASLPSRPARQRRNNSPDQGSALGKIPNNDPAPGRGATNRILPTTEQDPTQSGPEPFIGTPKPASSAPPDSEAEFKASSLRLLQIKETITLLKGDLDWIVMKCLEKDRTRRYATANELADDLNRHLSNEPVTARPPSTVYKFQKFVRRNKAAVTATVSIFLGLVVVLILGWFSYQRERAARAASETSRIAEFAQRQRAQGEAARAEAGTRRAEAEALRARRFQYASDMNLAHQAVEDGDLFRALKLLDRHRPGSRPGDEAQTPSGKGDQSLTAAATEDLRGWEWRYLWKQCAGDDSILLGSHSNGVSAVGFLPGGKTAFTAGSDNAVRLWDMESKRQVAVLPHATNVTGAACSPDGLWLATSTEHTLLLWDLANQQATPVLLTNAWLRPNTLAFSPDSQMLAFVDYHLGVQVWSVAGRKLVARLPAYHHWLARLGVAFSPDGQTLAYTENEAGDIVLWNVRGQSVVRRLKGHSGYVTALAFTPDGRLLVSGGNDRTVKVWDAASGLERTTLTNYGPSLGVAVLSPDGKMLATAATPGGQRITVQEIPGGREIIRLQGHKNWVNSMAFSPDERTLLSGSSDGTVRLWDLASASNETGHRPFPSDIDEFAGGSSPAYSLSPDGRHLLTVFTNHTFSVWELPALIEGPRHPLPVGRAACAALAAGGQLAAFVTTNGDVVFWHAETGETNWFARPTTNVMSRAVFSPDGQRFAVSGALGVSACDVPGGRTLFTRPIADDFVFSLAFSPDGQKLVAGLGSGIVKAWDMAKRTPESTLRGHDRQVNGVALLPDGRTLVSTAQDIRLWDLTSSTNLLVLNPRHGLFRCAAISTDGRQLAVGANDGLITIWDLASKQEVATLAGHTRFLLALSFLPDGNTLVSIGVDQIRVWRAASLEETDAPRDPR